MIRLQGSTSIGGRSGERANQSATIFVALLAENAGVGSSTAQISFGTCSGP